MRVLLVLLLVAFAFALDSTFFSTRPENDPTYSELVEGLPEEENGAIILRSFQGSYTSTGGYLSTIYFCVQPDNTVHGSYDEVGLIQGQVLYKTDGTATMSGDFYEAGTSDCETGTFEIELTTWGFTGSYKCKGGGKSFKWEEVRTSNVRPSNEQCAILSTEDLDIEGVWEDDADLPISICTTSGKATASYTIAPSPSYWGNALSNGYFEGTSYLGGRVLGGTWYETQGRTYNFRAGAMLMFLRENGDLGIFKWTGLNGGEGVTAIDPTQILDESKHRVQKFRFYMGDIANENDCAVNDGNKGFVLLNLHDDDEDYYYFVGSDWFNSQYVAVYDVVGAEYLNPPVSGAASLSIVVSVLLLCLSLFV